jgi:hypothetical protein
MPRVAYLPAICIGLSSPLFGQNPPAGARVSPVLRVDPRLLTEAAEVWHVIASPGNPIWPGWDATHAPATKPVYRMCQNPPSPPAGFMPYRPHLGLTRVVVRDGATIASIPGQNTSRDIEGVGTLVVADPEGPVNPYHELALIAHEAFHVFQERVAPGKGANEMLLLRYPVLSADNNVGFALEGLALSEALRAVSASEVRAGAVRWVAARETRRAALSPEAIEYEDGVEFSEGLAKYVELRLLESLQGRSPGAGMSGIQGFHGYTDLTEERSALIDMMLRNMRGEVVVNNAPYGTAPLRMRLYWSGMGIAALLDRLSPGWKDTLQNVSLTRLAQAVIGAAPGEVTQALTALRHDANDDSLRAVKKRFAMEGRALADTMLAAIDDGLGTGIIVDYSALTTSAVALGFTPFGITVVDSSRTIFAQVPIRARFPNGAEIMQTEPLPLLKDTQNRVLRFRLPRELSADEMRHVLSTDSAPVTLELPGVRISAPRATIRREGRDLRIVLR